MRPAGDVDLGFIDRSVAALGVDGDDHRLRAEAFGHLGDQLGSAYGRRVHGDLVGPGLKEHGGIGQRAHSAADGEGDEQLARGAAHGVDQDGPRLVRRGDVEQHDFIGAAFGVAVRQLRRIAGIAQIEKLHALDHAARWSHRGRQ